MIKTLNLGDLQPLHLPGMNSRVEQTLHNMTDEELLETVIYPRDGQHLKVYANSYVLVDGNTRYYEIIRRMEVTQMGCLIPICKSRLRFSKNRIID